MDGVPTTIIAREDAMIIQNFDDFSLWSTPLWMRYVTSVCAARCHTMRERIALMRDALGKASKQ